MYKMSRMKSLSLFLLVLLSMGTFAANQAQYIDGKVISITDGDTFRIESENRRITVKLAGVDAPYKNQEYGMKARQMLGNLLFNKNIRIKVVARTGVSYLEGVVYLDNKDVNAEMVRHGYAWVIRDAGNINPLLLKYETEARNFRRGLWAGNHPVPPWLWRKLNK